MYLDSPFQSGGEAKTVTTIDQNQKLVMRVESGGTFQVNFKINGIPSDAAADGFLNSGDAVEIPGPGTVTVISITGDPEIYWYVK